MLVASLLVAAPSGVGAFSDGQLEAPGSSSAPISDTADNRAAALDAHAVTNYTAASADAILAARELTLPGTDPASAFDPAPGRYSVSLDDDDTAVARGGLALGKSVTANDDDTPGLVVLRTGLVGNSGQSGNESVILSSGHAQAFYTGNNPGGYGVGSVTIISEDPENDPMTLSLNPPIGLW